MKPNKLLVSMALIVTMISLCAVELSAEKTVITSPTRVYSPKEIEGRGLLPEPIDQSLMKPAPYTPTALAPASWDWRTLGGVTPVKDQGNYYTCVPFALLSVFESQFLINEAITRDYSEMNLWSCGVHPFGLSCNNGWTSASPIGYLSSAGSVLESDDPYGRCPNPICLTYPYQQRVSEWQVLPFGNMNAVKDAIQNYGPVYASMNSDAFPVGYDGSTCITLANAGADHTVAIVGWDDAMCSGNGAWIIKNNYNAGWGDNGYGYVRYGRADLVGWTAIITAYRDVDPNEHIIAYDEAGYNNGVGFSVADYDDWGMAVIDPTSSNDELTAVEFWTGTPTTNYWIYVYDTFSGGSLSSLLAGPIAGSAANYGYYSVELASPVALTAGNPVYVAIRYQIPVNVNWQYPIPTDAQGGKDAGKSYVSDDGASWRETLVGEGDVCIRGRLYTGTPVASITVTSPNGGENWVVGSAHNVTWTSSGASALVDIDYSINSGAIWTPIFSNTPNDGTEPWTIPNTPSATCLVRVTDDDGSPTDASNAVFTISTDGPTCDQPMLSLLGYRTVSWAAPIWTVQVQVLNAGPGVAKNVTVTMNDDLVWLTIPDPNCAYGDIALGASSWGNDSYTFDLTNHPGGSFNVWFDVAYYDDCGNQYNLRLDPEFDVETTQATPVLTYRLGQNYPNPFNPNTTISFQLPAANYASLNVYDITGKLVRTLVNEQRSEGLQSVNWNGKDNSGVSVASGIYFYKLQSGSFTETKKMVLMR